MVLDTRDTVCYIGRGGSMKECTECGAPLTDALVEAGKSVCNTCRAAKVRQLRAHGKLGHRHDVVLDDEHESLLGRLQHETGGTVVGVLRAGLRALAEKLGIGG